MPSEVTIELEHAALCCNKSCNCVDIGPNDIVSFGSSNSVVIYQPTSWKEVCKQSIMTYNHHSGKVLCTKWVEVLKVDRSKAPTEFLLSGSFDKSVAVWRYSRDASFDSQLQLITTLNGHADSITAIDAILIEDDNLFIIATAAADSTVKVWMGLEAEEIDFFQTLDFKNAFVLDVALQCLPHCGVPLLACACDDFKLKLYAMKRTVQQENIRFEKVAELPGHEDWVRGVDFIAADDNSLYLTSCSQDTYIRLWKLTSGKEENSDDLRLKKHYFTVHGERDTTYQYSVAIDAVLCGHDNWVYSCRLYKSPSGEILLLSSSIDKTVVIWKYDTENQAWVDDARVGEIGGNTLGFYGAHFSSDCSHLVAHSYSGALHGWDRSEKNFWEGSVLVSGHADNVNDLAWEPNQGRYLISVSEDQTARLFAEWKRDGSWHEIARPQIHGYDMQCLAVINSTKYVSGADEKVLRVFDASRHFVENFLTLTDNVIDCQSSETPQGATVPALGLSNKAVLAKEEPVVSDRREQYIENLFSPINLSQPPPESYLLQNTLWPESRKVYGHVYEIFCIACSHSGAMVASAARSSQPKHAGIMVWDVSSWRQACTLPGHALTVTQMEFSPCDKYLLSVSRDRTWILHRATDPEAFRFETAAKSDKKSGHSRIIWSCSWTHDSKIFATASRDKKVSLWRLSGEADLVVDRISVVDCKEPATAVSFSHSSSTPSSYEFAIGLESGAIKLFRLTSDNTLIDLVHWNSNLSHCLTVKRLKWKPGVNKSDAETSKVLASCGQDNQVKLFKIRFVDSN